MKLVRLRDFDPSAEIVRDAPFTNLGFNLRAARPGLLTYAGTLPFLRQAAASPEVSGILTSRKTYDLYRRKNGEIEAKGLALVSSPREGFFRFHNFLVEHTDFYRRSGQSSIGEGARIRPTAVVSSINVQIGARVVIDDHVVIHDNVRIGDDVHIGAGSVLGGPGFQYLATGGNPLEIIHAGGVSIGSNVDIHAHCSVDRAIFHEDTVIGDGSKLDNGVHFAHASRMGKRGLLAAKACVCGSVAIGDDVWIGPAAVVSNNIAIGNRASIAIGAVVVRDVADGEAVAGNFAIDRDLFVERNLKAILAPSKDD